MEIKNYELTDVLKHTLNKFKNGKIIVCCNSENMAKNFIHTCYENNVKWFDNSNDENTFWDMGNGKDIYYNFEDNMLWWGSLEQYENKNKEIICWE